MSQALDLRVHSQLEDAGGKSWMQEEAERPGVGVEVGKLGL